MHEVVMAAYGVAIGARSPDGTALTALRDRVCNGGAAETIAPTSARPQRWLELSPSTGPGWQLRVDGSTFGAAGSREHAVEAAASAWEFALAELTDAAVFVHAGVVGWRGRSVVLPGRSHTGKSTLVAALVAAGATYYSDEFAVVLPDGRVAAFPRPIALRTGGGAAPLEVDPEVLGGRVGTVPVRPALVVLTRYREGARWNPHPLPPGRAMLRLLRNAVAARRRPEQTLQSARCLLADAVVLGGPRGEARETAARILEHLDTATPAGRRP